MIFLQLCALRRRGAAAALGFALLSSVVAAQSPSPQRVPVPDGNLVFEESGSGPLVVLLHGAFMDRAMWDGQVAALSKSFRVVRYDIRPFGESQLHRPYAPIADLEFILNRFGAKRAHLVGHSFGAAVAIDFAIAFPDRVASLVLVGGAAPGIQMPEDERKAAGAVFAAVKDGDDAIVRAWLAQPMWKASAARPAVVKVLDAMTRRSLHAFRMKEPPFIQKPATIDQVAAIKAPTLVVVGDQDSVSLLQASDRLAQTIPGAVLTVVPGADHALPIGWAPELNAVMLPFLAARPRD